LQAPASPGAVPGRRVNANRPGSTSLRLTLRRIFSRILRKLDASRENTLSGWSSHMAKKSVLPALTSQQQRILNYISAFLASEGQAPTLEEIRDHLRLAAVSTVHEHTARLVDKGYLSRDWNRSRTMALTPQASEQRTTRLIPLKGTVLAGHLIERARDRVDIAVPVVFVAQADGLALRMGDDSLADNGIRKGDTLVIAQRDQIRNGALVIGTVKDGNVVVKRFFKRGRTIELRSPVEGQSRTTVAVSDVTILGEVVALMRRYP
jgi:repressor LexA